VQTYLGVINSLCLTRNKFARKAIEHVGHWHLCHRSDTNYETDELPVANGGAGAECQGQINRYSYWELFNPALVFVYLARLFPIKSLSLWWVAAAFLPIYFLYLHNRSHTADLRTPGITDCFWHSTTIIRPYRKVWRFFIRQPICKCSVWVNIYSISFTIRFGVWLRVWLWLRVRLTHSGQCECDLLITHHSVNEWWSLWTYWVREYRVTLCMSGTACGSQNKTQSISDWLKAKLKLLIKVTDRVPSIVSLTLTVTWM